MDKSDIQEKYWPLMDTAEDEETAIRRLTDIIRILRVECPWDRKQDHVSLRTAMIEEAYEVVDAIERTDTDNLREELGDVQLQIVFHSLLAEEEGHFDLTDVINEECEKMIRRHPHVFSDGTANTVDKVLEKWENIKEREHVDESYTDTLKRVPKALPALVRSYKVQAKAANVGFDWDDVSGPLEKVAEELDEVKEAMDGGKPEKIEEEIGDLLFAAVNAARFLDTEPEDALRKATEKFIRRFQAMESLANERSLDIRHLTLEEMDGLWGEIKKHEA